MLRGNRVFFADEGAALDAGFRPCGHCMQDAYLCDGGKGGQQSDLITARIWQLPVN